MGVLEIHNLSKDYSGTVVLNDFSLNVTELTLCCLLGPNGAGKTTTMDMITGRQKPSSGKIMFNGEDITALDEYAIARRGIGRKFQIPAVFKDLSVRQNLDVAYSRQTSPFRNMFSFRDRAMNERRDEVAIQVGLIDRLDAEAGTLSHGETQWLEMGMVLMQNPTLLLMDEPAAGMTEQEIEKTCRIFNTLKKSHTLVVVEHDMAFVREIADVVTVMHMGSHLASGTIDQIEGDAKVREVYLGNEEH